MSLFTRVVTSTAHSKPIEKVVTGTRPGRALANRFVAGDTLDEAVKVAKTLNDDGFLVSLDLLGEEVHDEASARAAGAEYLESLEIIGKESLRSNISVKLTQLGLAIDRDLTTDLIGQLAAKALEVGTSVTIDMEDSRYTADTVDVYESAQTEYGNVGIAIQAYMKRTPDDLERLLPLDGHIRLCKGAYVEPPEVALTMKRSVDAAYESALEVLMQAENVKPAIATHDLKLIDSARSMAPQRMGYFEFQMLYGVRATLQKELVAEGHPLRIYLPFGSQWYPYLTRRMAERPANVWFFAKSLFG